MFKYIAIALLATLGGRMAAQQTPPAAVNSQTRCQGLLNLTQMTISRAELRSATESTPAHCYVQGVIDSRIRFHMQRPLQENWNGRLVNIGDGGKDGQLDFSVEFSVNRLRQGHAVANSNSGHDSAAEPRATFADQDIAAVIDFGYRAVHLTANASKFIVRSYYGRPPAYTYFEGCSTGDDKV